MVDTPKNYETVTKTANLNEYDVNNSDVWKLNKWLQKFWTTEIKTFPENKKWPYLIIFKENHIKNNIKVENFNAFINNKDYFNLLTTEWTDQEKNWVVKYKGVSILIWNIRKTTNFILQWHSELTSEAIEEFLWDKIDTIWVDYSSARYKQMERDILNYKAKVIWDKLRSKWLELKPKNTSKFTKVDRKEIDARIKEFYWKEQINKRDIVWLKNIFKTLKTNKYHNIWKNFIPIVWWWHHAPWLAKNAWKYWFKWVITFTAKWYE